jgi:hypothetical protein
MSRTAPGGPSMASVRLCNAMTRRYIIALFQRLIKKAQKQIGIVSFKIAQDENGMVSMGELMRQTRRFEIYFADNYKFNENQAHGFHIVISATDYKLIEYSSDPREGIQTRSFLTPADVSRHCALAQLTVAANISLSRDKAYKSLDPKKSYEQLMRQIVLVQEHRQMLTERIDHYLRSKEARLISWLIKSLPKGNLSPQSSGTPR